MQPMLPVATTSGRTLLDVGDLAVAQLGGDRRLQDVVGAGRAAAQVALGDLHHREAGVAQQLARLVDDALAVLHRAGRVIGDAQRRPALGRAHVVAAEELGDVAGHGGELGGALGILGLALQHVRRSP